MRGNNPIVRLKKHISVNISVNSRRNYHKPWHGPLQITTNHDMNHHDDPKRALHKAIWLPCLLFIRLFFRPLLIQGFFTLFSFILTSFSGACLFNDINSSLWNTWNKSDASLSFNSTFQSIFDRSSLMFFTALLFITLFRIKVFSSCWFEIFKLD